MSEFDLVEKITDRAGTGAVNFSNGFNVNGSDSGISSFTHTEGANEPSSPSNGDTWWDSDNDIYKVYMNNEWKDWLGTTTPAASHYGDRAHKVGISHSSSNTIEYWDMTSAGNASDFGDLTSGRYGRTGMCSDGTRIYNPVYQDPQIDYWTSATLGNASDYGDLQYGTFDSDMEADGSKALLVHGYARDSGTNYVGGIGNKIEQFTVGTGSAGVTATDFGNQLTSSNELFNTASNGTRMLIAGGLVGSSVTNTIAYVTFATAGNAVDAGDLNQGRFRAAGAGSGSGDIACFAGGGINNSGSYVNSIDQKNISNTNNATDFGDLTGAIYFHSGCYNATKGHFNGGYNTTSSAVENTIQQVTFDTAGNATDFGDLVSAAFHTRASSGAAS